VYGSRGGTFPPIFFYMLLPCDRWQQKGSLTKWVSDMEACKKQRCVSKFLCMENVAPIDIHCRLVALHKHSAVDMRAQRGGVWCVLADNDSGSSLLVQRFVSMACRLLFVAGENT